MSDFGDKLFSNVFGGLFCAAYLVAGFPGGTIAMAVMRDSNELHALDWIASVIIPFYGILKAFAVWG